MSKHTHGRGEAVANLAERRERAVPLPDGPPAIETFLNDDRIIFRDQAALDEYVAGAQAGHTADSDAGNIVQRIVNAWDCCATCAGGVLAEWMRANTPAGGDQ